jgi:hypothetical protein
VIGDSQPVKAAVWLSYGAGRPFDGNSFTCALGCLRKFRCGETVETGRWLRQAVQIKLRAKTDKF